MYKQVLFVVEEKFEDVLILGIQPFQQIHFISTCSQNNILNAYGYYDNIYFSSFYNPLSMSQKFTCGKLHYERMGKAMENFEHQDISAI